MALVTTTLSTALTGVGPLAEKSIVVASATSIAPGRVIKIGKERMIVSKAYSSGTTVPVLRGQFGSFASIHPASVNVVHGDPSDFAAITPQANVDGPQYLTFSQNEYSASGEILTGEAWVTFVNIIGTSTLAMTLALPDKTQDGQILIISGNAKSQSTIATTTAGFGNAGASYDTFTLQNAGNVALMLVANNGFWSVLNSPITGTSTAFSAGIA